MDKIYGFAEDLNLGHKSKLWKKIEILDQKRNFGHKSK